MLWHAITSFGDSGVMIPTALSIAVVIFLQRRKRLALRWGVTVLSACGVVALTKLFFLSTCIRLSHLEFTGLSGHATMAALVFPVLARLTVRTPATDQQNHAYYSGECLAILIGVSRLAMHVHSIEEVVAGLACGFMLGRLFLKSAGTDFQMAHLDYRRSIAPLLLLAAVFYLHPAPTQLLLQRIAYAMSSDLQNTTGMTSGCDTALQ